jgi:hypothetical protein
VTDIKQILIGRENRSTKTENDEFKLLFNNRLPSDKLLASVVDVMIRRGEKSLNNF